jgi:hypothetical protein
VTAVVCSKEWSRTIPFVISRRVISFGSPVFKFTLNKGGPEVSLSGGCATKVSANAKTPSRSQHPEKYYERTRWWLFVFETKRQADSNEKPSGLN